MWEWGQLQFESSTGKRVCLGCSLWEVGRSRVKPGRRRRESQDLYGTESEVKKNRSHREVACLDTMANRKVGRGRSYGPGLEQLQMSLLCCTIKYLSLSVFSLTHVCLPHINRNHSHLCAL